VLERNVRRKQTMRILTGNIFTVCRLRVWGFCRKRGQPLWGTGWRLHVGGSFLSGSPLVYGSGQALKRAGVTCYPARVEGYGAVLSSSLGLGDRASTATVTQARGSVARRSRVRDPTRSLNSSLYLILPAALDPGIYSASNRNEYQKQKNNVSGEESAAGAWD
jgi:hypothetical protein